MAEDMPGIWDHNLSRESSKQSWVKTVARTQKSQHVFMLYCVKHLQPALKCIDK